MPAGAKKQRKKPIIETISDFVLNLMRLKTRRVTKLHMPETTTIRPQIEVERISRIIVAHKVDAPRGYPSGVNPKNIVWRYDSGRVDEGICPW